MKEPYELIRDLVANTDLTVTVESASYNAGLDQTTMTVDTLLHLRQRMKITFDGVNYVDVVSVDRATKTLVVGGDYSSETAFIVEPLFFINGTPLMANAEIERAGVETKYPMAYLYEVIREDIQPFRKTRQFVVRMFMIDNTLGMQWQTVDHYQNLLKGLRALANRLIARYLEQQRPGLQEDFEFTYVNHVNWGKFMTDKGHVAKIFQDDLSAVELTFTYYDFCCDC